MSTARDSNTLVVGTRGSLLARTQTQWVIDRLQAAHPGLTVTTHIITTKGDVQQDRPLPEIGGKGLFTEELEAALLDGSIDLAIHSAKDLPTVLHEGLGVIAFPRREDPRDAWVSRDGTPFDQLLPGSIVGTTSLRRQAQLLARKPDLSFIGLRGNIDTRIRKVHRGDCAGAVLAMAGLNRAGLSEHVTHPFEPEVCLPAPGQGALAVEGRADDPRVRSLTDAINDPDTAAAVRCERAILQELDAGCRAPVGILAVIEGGRLRCDALVIDPRGQHRVATSVNQSSTDVAAAAEKIVSDLRAGGAEQIIAACR